MTYPADRSPALLDPGYFQLVADRWRLKLLAPPVVTEWATVALAHGHNGPALRELAWPHTDWLAVDPLVPGAIAELGLTVATRREAVARLLRPYADAALAGSVPLRAGCEALSAFVWQLDTADLPEGLDRYWLDHVLEAWHDREGPAQVQVEAQLHALLATLSGRAPRPPAGDAPSLGGRHAPPEPGPAQAPPAPKPDPETASSSRFSFEFSFNTERGFSWSWPPRGGN